MADTNTASQRPWTWDFNDDDQRIIYDANGDCIAQVFNLDADAALIVEAVNGWTESARKLVTSEADLNETKRRVAALAKPARNCDRYANAKDAIRTMAEYCLRTACDECPYRANGNGFFACTITWFLAKAEEGESNE